MLTKKIFSALSFAIISAVILGACAAPAAPQTVVQVQTVVVPGTPETVIVTATPETAEATPVTVLSLWGGSEQEAFQKVLDGFTASTGIPTQYEQARDFLPVLR